MRHTWHTFMPKESENGMPDNPDPHEQLRYQITQCAEKQKGYDVGRRVKDAPVELLNRMRNKPLSMMYALLEEFEL